MSRVSTVGLYSTAVLAINTAQDRLATATQQANTGKIAQDLSGYGADSEKIVAQRSLQSRIQSHIQNGTVLSSRLDLQDQALQSVSTAAGDAHTAIAQALASGDGSALMTQLQSALSTASTALNTRFNGQYIFAGSQTTTAPVSANQLSDLTAAGAIANVFHNDQLATTNRLDDNTVVTTGQLADSVGTPLMTALQSVEAYNQGANGPISGTLTAAQTTFLQGVLASFATAQSQATSDVVQNGAVQQQLKSTTSVLKAQDDTLTNSLSDLTDVNEAQAANDLQLAQFAFQASARVFNSLQSSSLLSILPIA